MAREIARHTVHGTYMIEEDTGAVFRKGYRRMEGTDYSDPYFRKWADFDPEAAELLSYIRYAVIRDHTDVLQHKFSPSVLDFGCGTGDFIIFARRQPYGYGAQGYDLHRNESNRALHHTFTDPGLMSLKIRHWDVLTMFDVIEHMEDPAPVLTSIPHRWLVVTVPNADPSLFAGTGDFWRWRHLRPTEHIHHFNTTSLPLYLAKFGYTCTFLGSPEDEVRTNDGQTFPNTLTGVFRWNGSS